MRYNLDIFINKNSMSVRIMMFYHYMVILPIDNIISYCIHLKSKVYVGY